jgi:hypothetical protein
MINGKIERGLMVSRRNVTAGLGLLLLSGGSRLHAAEKPEMTIYKDPNCGCCQGWADHIAASGFATQVISRDDLGAMKAALGVPPGLQSCHTARIAGYVIEGHVPAAAIHRLLAEKPQAIGLAVPGMPVGSPGMEGGEPEIYAVALFDSAGQRPFGRFREAKEVL